jgi:hypothetical protein
MDSIASVILFAVLAAIVYGIYWVYAWLNP